MNGKSVPEKLKWLYEYLPEEYIGYQMIEPTSVLLNVSPERAKQYLQMLEMFGMVKRSGWKFIKVDKQQKKMKLEDITEFQVEE